ncbi:zinc finger protein ZOP1 [Cynara cardunculus var. scolymus]|uniref:zinc finger protein ZOP1 n=1 Tax=Cynara cardunculus var. scolymus TaxID=59895 RepID=UPI000D6241D3|nr:zinc finger protein ZOP1 [Cynara cardunculus var. scolymus]XP_024980618.1 zinc finger protein ZOP1 [Cynara cardunculus var. scolymus]
MTEYWVSQGKKWCDLCKIFISNNPSSIKNHELGQRHKDNVTKRLANMREEKVAKDKEKKETARVLTQIEEKASRSYQKDISTFQRGRDSNDNSLGAQTSSEAIGSGSTTSGEWEHDASSGYQYNRSNGCYYDPNSGFYYTDALGKWVPKEEALAAAAKLSSGPIQKKPSFTTMSSTLKSHTDSKTQTRPVNPTRSVNRPSSLAINKRKRPDAKSKVVSEEEAAALKAREAARKRVEEREKSSLGLYKH